MHVPVFCSYGVEPLVLREWNAGHITCATTSQESSSSPTPTTGSASTTAVAEQSDQAVKEASAGVADPCAEMYDKEVCVCVCVCRLVCDGGEGKEVMKVCVGVRACVRTVSFLELTCLKSLDKRFVSCKQSNA